MLKLDEVIIQDLNDIIAANVEWEKLRCKTVLITGANGMLASYIIYTLLYLNEIHNYEIKVLAIARNYEKALKRFHQIIKNEALTIIGQDVIEPFQYEGNIDYIIHAASQTNPKQFENDPVGTIKANTIGTINMLDIAVAKNAQGFLYLSTREIYGEPIQNVEYVSEEHYGVVNPVLVRSCYPESKRIAETLCMSYMQQHRLNCKIARIEHVYGPGMVLGDGRVVGDFINNVVHNKNILMKSEGKVIISLTYLSDAITGLFKILLDFNENIYNLSSNDAVFTVKDFAHKLCDIFREKKIDVKTIIPDNAVNNGYLQNRVALLDSSKAKKEGWKPKIDFVTGIKRLVEYAERNEFVNGENYAQNFNFTKHI